MWAGISAGLSLRLPGSCKSEVWFLFLARVWHLMSVESYGYAMGVNEETKRCEEIEDSWGI